MDILELKFTLTEGRRGGLAVRGERGEDETDLRDLIAPAEPERWEQ